MATYQTHYFVDVEGEQWGKFFTLSEQLDYAVKVWRLMQSDEATKDYVVSVREHIEVAYA